MNLDNISVELRPRDGWQSIDLGFQMARRWFLPLLSLWLCLSIPVYAAVKLLQLPGFATLIVWWWFKPLYEAPLSYWCSRAMFSEPVSHRQALHQTFKQFLKLLVSYLSIRRLSTSRSQNINVVMLENLSGKQRRARIAVLDRMATRTFALITICFHFEAILFYGLLILFMLLSPSGSEVEHTVRFLFGGEESSGALIITEVTTIMVAGLVAPFYVCAGFSLYINRRTQLEAWDIELDFRRTASRPRSGNSKSKNSQFLAVTLLSILLTLPLLPTGSTEAATSRVQARLTIDEVLSEDDFGYTTTVRKLRLKETAPEEMEEKTDYSWVPNLGDWIYKIAQSIETLLWFVFITVIALLIFAIYKNSTAIRAMAERLGFRRQKPPGSVLFELDIRPQSLPEDIPLAASDLITQGRKREAMSLLYRGALSRLVHLHGMTIETSNTEQECVTRVFDEQPQQRSTTFHSLTSLWQQTAYAQSQPDTSALTDICEQWRSAFDVEKHD